MFQHVFMKQIDAGCKHVVGEQTVLELNKIKAVPTVLSGCENLTSLKGRKKRTENAELKVFRAVAEHAFK